MEPNKTNAQAPIAEEGANIEKKISKKKVISICVGVGAVVLFGLLWYFLATAASHKADEAIALADVEMNDSIKLERYMDAAKLGHKSGNRAKLEVAIALYQKGEYEEAIKYLEDASVSSDIIEAGKYALMGDCYVNLKNYDKALSAYQKAIKEADNNPQIVPFVLVKEANIYREQGNYEAEYKAYETIYDKYPEYAKSLSNIDIRKYAERARAAAGK